jgi:glucose/arabinose dehydrogenase
MRQAGIALIVALLMESALAGTPGAPTLELISANVQRPVAIRHSGDGSGRLFVIEQTGKIRIIRGGNLLSQAFLDLSSLVPTIGQFDERGLLGLAFHPSFSVNRRFFVYYTDTGSDTVVAEYQASMANPDVAETNGIILLRVDQDFNNHNGGDIHFGPDGYLYIGLGDGGSAGDPCDRAQTLDPANLNNITNACPPDASFANKGGNPDSRALLGKMLRIDIDGATAAGDNGLCGSDPTSGAAGYAIPGDNPFAGADANLGCDEIWAYGLRNPYRFSFDRSTGDLWIGDVGQNVIEEVDLQPAASSGGENYGWDDCEGSNNYEGTGCPSSNGRTAPVMEYSHSGGRCSLTGGFRYRGEISDYAGAYVFGDYCTGEILIGRFDSGWSFQVLIDPNTDTSGYCPSGLCLSGFGESQSGDLYVADLSGQIFRLSVFDQLFYDGFEGP